MIEVIKMNLVKVKIEKSESGYSAYMDNGLGRHAINGAGKTIIEAINDLHVAIKEIRDMYTEDAKEIPAELIDLSFEYGYD